MNPSCLRILILAWTALSFSAAVSAQTLPDQFTIEGRLFVSGVALSGTVDIKLEVVDSGASTCVLYREVHSNVDVGTQGIFALKLGGGSALFHPQSRLSSVFANGVAQTGDSNGDNSADCNFTPSAGAQRLVRMSVSQNSGSTYTLLSPDTAVTTSPTAMVAETLQGKSPSDLVQVRDDVATDLSQANLENIFSATNYAKLNALVSGSSSQYMVANPSAAVAFNGQRITNVADPSAATDVATKGYTDGYIGGKTADLSTIGPAMGNGETLIWDQTAQKWKTGIPSATDASRLSLSGGQMSGAIDMAGNNILATGHITMSPQKVFNLGTFDNAQEAALVLTLLPSQKGASWYNSQDNVYKIWDGTNAISQAYLNSGKLDTAWMPSTTVTAGSYGSALQVPTFTVGADGRLTMAANVTISGVAPAGAAGGSLSGNYPNPTLADDAVTTIKIADNSVTDPKINGVSIDKLLNAAGKYFSYKPNATECTSGQVLKWDSTNKRWLCDNDADGFIGGAAGGDLTGNYPNPSINSNAITTPKVFANPGVNRLVASDSSSGATLVPFECTGTQIMQWSGSGWACVTISTALGTSYIVDGGNTRGAAISIGSNDDFDLNFETNNTTKMVVKKTGNVGIGTVTPTALLDVNGMVQSTLFRTSGNSGTAYNPTSGASSSPQGGLTNEIVNSSSTVGAFSSLEFSVASGGNWQSAYIGAVGNSVGNSPDIAIGRQTGSNAYNEALRINAAGNVGIGTTAPIRLLDVAGSVRIAPTPLPTSPAAGDLAFDSTASNALKFYDGTIWKTVGTAGGDFLKNGSVAMTGNFNAGGNSILGNTTPSANLKLESTSDVTKGFVLLQPNGGNVGIGISTPSQRLHIDGGSIMVSDTSGTKDSELYLSNNHVYRLISGKSGSSTVGTGGFGIYDGTAASLRFLIDQNGNVGIGTANPTTTGSGRVLQVHGTSDAMTHFTNSSTGTSAADGLFVGNATGFAQIWNMENEPLTFGTNQTERMRISASGALGIGTNSPSTGAALEVYGDTASSSSMIIPRGLTGDRPTIGINGMMRYNTSLEKFEVYEFGNWTNIVPSVASGDFLKDGTVSMTGTFKAANGSAASPGITFSGDPDNGIFRPATDNIGISTGGAERMHFDNTGRVGIGTSTPTSRLHIYANTTGYEKLTISNAAAGTGSGSSLELDSGSSAALITKNGPSSTSTLGPVGSLDMGTAANEAIVLYTGNTHAMTISGFGQNVGIGTTVPTTKLEVVGAIVSRTYNAAVTASIDLSKSNVVTISPSSNAISLSGMVDGGTYTIVVRDPTSRTYTFPGCTNQYFRPANAPTLASSQTIFSILTIQNGGLFDCYINWNTGYN